MGFSRRGLLGLFAVAPVAGPPIAAEALKAPRTPLADGRILGAPVNNPATSVPTTVARIVTEECARACADAAVVTRITVLEAHLPADDPGSA